MHAAGMQFAHRRYTMPKFHATPYDDLMKDIIYYATSFLDATHFRGFINNMVERKAVSRLTAHFDDERGGCFW